MELTEKKAQALAKNVEAVARKKDIKVLSKDAYEFIILKMGFIAHYNLFGFQDVYEDLREFFLRLQTGEYSRERDYNLDQAERQANDLFFKNNYGEENQKNTAWLMKELVNIARRYENEVGEHFNNKEKDKDLSVAKKLAGKYGYELSEIK